MGKVLAGIQVPDEREGELAKFLAEIGYGYTEVTNNESYQMFMRE